MARALLVFGPESSGTRLVTSALIAAGCDGDSVHVQRWDQQPLPEHDCVWRRSLPHGNVWPNIGELVDICHSGGHEPLVVVTIRELKAMVSSQMSAGHIVRPEQGIYNAQRAMREIYQCIIDRRLPHYVLSYEAMAMYSQKAFMSLAEWAGLNVRSAFPVVRDQNLKYY